MKQEYTIHSGPNQPTVRHNGGCEQFQCSAYDRAFPPTIWQRIKHTLHRS